MYTGSTIQGAAGSARRVWEVLQTELSVADKPHALRLDNPRGHLRFEKVTFGYEPGRPVLKDLFLDVPAGQTLAIVGMTGAGKSTLVSLVPRFFDPWQGTVLLDDHDLRDVQLKSLRRHVALVLQEPFLFPISIAENIAYGSPHATFSRIEAAARAANADEFIRRLPDGYHTIIGERGGTLSGGERQRISIARALLKDAPILILDEPTSALDAETEQALLRALEQLTRGRTTLIIAHRLSTIRRAHRILVLKDGEIVESGTRAELLARGGAYARFHELQSGGTASSRTTESL
jgi:ATP-binding cassette subfamily B protein/subfamily B ATP-binding cassette protein MsbA